MDQPEIFGLTSEALRRLAWSGSRQAVDAMRELTRRAYSLPSATPELAAAQGPRLATSSNEEGGLGEGARHLDPVSSALGEPKPAGFWTNYRAWVGTP